MASPVKKAVLDLRPTQFVVGMKEVEDKVQKLKNFGHGERRKYLEDHVVPCVIGPKAHVYLIDHHHFVHACWQSQIDEVFCETLADKESLSPAAFWEFMKKSEWVYLYDQFGKGPHDPAQLPFDIRGVSDDPYRSLAWELRDAGVIEKVQKPFAEFRWAALLRRELKFDLHQEPWKKVVEHSIDLVRKELAKSK